jgi:hypothetical protein
MKADLILPVPFFLFLLLVSSCLLFVCHSCCCCSPFKAAIATLRHWSGQTTNQKSADKFLWKIPVLAHASSDKCSTPDTSDHFFFISPTRSTDSLVNLHSTNLLAIRADVCKTDNSQRRSQKRSLTQHWADESRTFLRNRPTRNKSVQYLRRLQVEIN